MSQSHTVSVTILDKEYQVVCPEEEETALITSANYLDKQMRSIRESGKVIGLERIAVMAALNISHELLQASDREPAVASVNEDRVTNLNRKIDDALYQLRQLPLQ